MVIIGYSGHGLVVAEAALLRGDPLKYYTEKEIVNFNPYQLEYAGIEGSDEFLNKKITSFVLGIGDNNLRYNLAKKIEKLGLKAPNVNHPHSEISRYAKIGKGNFFAKGSLISAFATIGNYCIINTGAIVEHECVLEDGVHIAPGCILAGNVHVGEKAFIGANAVIKQGVRIGKNVIIGAGSVIIKDVDDGLKIVGNPGRIL